MKQRDKRNFALASLALGFICGLMPTSARAQFRDPVRLDAPFSCTIPVSQRRQEAGCYITAIEPLKNLPKGPLFWHLYTYPTMEEAERAKGSSTGTVVNSLSKIWLFKIAPADWKPASGRKVAVIGPLPRFEAKEYEARYLESIKLAPAPGGHTPVHRHPGVEAWYVVSGGQCMQIPDKTFFIRAGETGLVPAGVPMMLTPLPHPERTLVLVLQDANQPWMTKANDWKPSAPCAQ